MPETLPVDTDTTALTIIRTAHTIVWAFFVACIMAIPVASWFGAYQTSVWLAMTVFIEVLILVVNRLQCPLTTLAARYTVDRSANFDIYLPRWLAQYNKVIFGGFYVCGVAYAAIRWLRG
jgi:hypothetical protein